MSRQDRYDARSQRYTSTGGGGRYGGGPRDREQDNDGRDDDRRRRRYERHGDAPTRGDGPGSIDAPSWSGGAQAYGGGYGGAYGANGMYGYAQPMGADGAFYPPQPPAQQPILTPEQIVALIQQQQQQQQQHQQQPMNNSTGSHAPVPSSVDSFVPVIPRSLMSVARGAGTKRSEGLSVEDLQKGKVVLDENGFPVFVPDPLAAASATEEKPRLTESEASNKANALMLMEAPKIAPATEQFAREARRLHISGFPKGTTEDELLDYFHLVLPDVRRLMTQREIEALAKESGLEESEVRTIPANANTGVDVMHSVRVSQAKSRDFAFIEFSLADIVTEMLEGINADPDRFQFPAADGRSYSLIMKRPKDYEALTGIDESRVVMVGFPPALSEDMLRRVAEQYGPVLKFQIKEGFAYMEFTSLKDALAFRTAMHGQVLASRMVVALPLSDWLKVLCHQIGIDVTIDESDPISGQAMLNRLAAGSSGGGGTSAEAGDANRAEAAASASGSGAANALVTSSAAAGSALVMSAAARQIDHMRELTGMETSILIAVFHLWQTYPHLRPLYGNQQVAVYPTRILVLLNLFDEEELTYDDTYSQLVADIEEEVEKHGRVVELIVPRRQAKPQAPAVPARGTFETQEEEDAAMAEYEEKKKAFNADFDAYMSKLSHAVYGAYGSVFVEYQTVDEAAHAQQQIAGKLFSGRTVVTSFLFEDILHEEKSEDEEGEEGEGEADKSPKGELDSLDGDDATPGENEAATHEGGNTEATAAPEASLDDLLEGID